MLGFSLTISSVRCWDHGHDRAALVNIALANPDWRVSSSFRLINSNKLLFYIYRSIQGGRMTIYEHMLSIFVGAGSRLYTASEIKSALEERYGRNPSSVIPSDYCYTRWNLGVTNQQPIFVRVGSGEYRFIGPDQPFTGLIFGRPRGASGDRVIGECTKGERKLYSLNKEQSR